MEKSAPAALVFFVSHINQVFNNLLLALVAHGMIMCPCVCACVCAVVSICLLACDHDTDI